MLNYNSIIYQLVENSKDFKKRERKEMTLVNGGAGRGRAEGTLACSGLKEDAIEEEEMDLRPEVVDEDGSFAIDLSDGLGRKTDSRRERGLGFKRFFEWKKSDDETADFIWRFTLVYDSDR